MTNLGSKNSIARVADIMLHDPLHSPATSDPEFSAGAAFVGGEYSPVGEAKIPLLDLGFRHADAAYDVVTVSRGSYFRLEEHLERMEDSCNRFGLKSPYTKSETTKILTNLVKKVGTKDAYVWWCVTRGLSKKGASDLTDSTRFDNQFYAYVVPYRFIADDDVRSRGMNIIISSQYVRIPPKSVDPSAKNFHWMDLQLSLFEAGRHGADLSVLCDIDGNLTESPGANIFIVKNGELYTPDSGCLLGITRRSVIEIAQELNIPVHIGKVTPQFLLDADEAFITSSAGGVMPVTYVNGISLTDDGCPGSVSINIHNLYWEKRWSGWHATAINYEN